MNEGLLDAGVAELVRETEFRIGGLDEGEGLSVTDSETELRLTARAPLGSGELRYEIELMQRGASNGVDLATDRRDVLQHYVVHLIGHIWRQDHGMSMMPTTVQPRGTMPEFHVVDESAGSYGIRRILDERWVASHLNKTSAHQIAVSLPRSVDELVASYRDPKGVPVYRLGAWWRRG